MPMVIFNAPETFQTHINNLFYGFIDVFMVVYMDDLFIYSKSVEEH